MPYQSPNQGFAKNQVVRISPYDHLGKVKNDLARKALPYYSQVARVVESQVREVRHKTVSVYKVRVDDGTLLELTEDSLIPVHDGF